MKLEIGISGRPWKACPTPVVVSTKCAEELEAERAVEVDAQPRQIRRPGARRTITTGPVSGALSSGEIARAEPTIDEAGQAEALDRKVPIGQGFGKR